MSRQQQFISSWHTFETEALFTGLLDSRPNGLTDQEAQRRFEQYGPNRLRPPRRRSPLQRLLLQFHNVLIYVLLAAGLITALLAHWVDTAVILGVVAINAVIGFIQEGKAERALEAVRRMLSLQTVVLRNGKRRTIPAEELVPGDMACLQSGDRVPADLRLTQVKNLRIDEAMLTGESEPVGKSTAPTSAETPLGDRTNMAFSGTLVTFGQGMGVVVATGDATEIGRISALLAQVRTLTTPLLRKMTVFSRWLTGAILVVAGVTFAFGILLRGYGAEDMFFAAVSLAVAAIPEGLPALITITLAIGVQRMARRNAIIRRLPAVETLGAVTVICSDKTGTLTRNEMTVQTVATAERLFQVSGVGYDPHGAFSLDGRDLLATEYPELLELSSAGVLCNDASLRLVNGDWQLDGDPTEGALLSLGLKAGHDFELIAEEFPRTDVIPFESQHRFMATLHHDHAGHGFIYAKGAPEVILERCALQLQAGEDRPLNPAYWHEQIEVIAGLGQRILAMAFRVSSSEHRELRFEDLDGGLTLLGLVGIIDPPREEAIRAVDRCQAAGISVKMITGDHAVTARAVAARMGIGDGMNALTGEDLNCLDDEALHEHVNRVNVFARTSPEHKLRLVQVLQAHGHVVAMTGDGINDAPALKRSDIGVAMGIKGTEAAKEAAEMVLADDNFASIAHAVEEGRTVYDNIKKSILFILPTNGGEGLTILAAVALGEVLPITPVQIMWVNMITAVTLALALCFEPPEADVMRRRPLDPRQPILTGLMIWRIVFVSLILVAGTFGLFYWERAQGASVETARTVAVNTLVLYEAFYLLNSRYLTAMVLAPGALFGNRYIILAIALVVLFQLLFTYTPMMQYLFQTTAIDLEAWGRIVAVTSTVFFLVELEKFVIRRWAPTHV